MNHIFKKGMAFCMVPWMFFLRIPFQECIYTGSQSLPNESASVVDIHGLFLHTGKEVADAVLKLMDIPSDNIVTTQDETPSVTDDMDVPVEMAEPVMPDAVEEAESIKDEATQCDVDVIQVPEVHTVEDMEEITMYATSSVNVRSGASTSYERIGSLGRGQAVTANGRADTGWFRISFQGVDAFVSDKYLSDTEPVVQEPAVSESTDGTVPQASTGMVESIGNVSSSWVRKAEARLSLLPQNVRDRFRNEGWHFYVTDENIGQSEFGGSIGSVAGATRYGEYIKIEDRQYAINEAVLHEFGHFVFHMNGDWTRQDVADAFAADVGNASSMGITYGLDNCSEFYAEVFQKYILNPGKTSECFPNLSAIIQSDMSNL